MLREISFRIIVADLYDEIAIFKIRMLLELDIKEHTRTGGRRRRRRSYAGFLVWLKFVNINRKYFFFPEIHRENYFL